jgi:hypothetical protein
MVHTVAAQFMATRAPGGQGGLHAFDFWADDAKHYSRLSTKVREYANATSSG